MSQRDLVRDLVFSLYRKILCHNGCDSSSAIDDGSLLFSPDFDSLSLAILVSELESGLGYDPFVLMDKPFYPRTIGDLVCLFETFAEHGIE